MNGEDLRKQIESLIRDEIQETINDYVDSKEESKESGIGFVSTEEEKNLKVRVSKKEIDNLIISTPIALREYKRELRNLGNEIKKLKVEKNL